MKGENYNILKRSFYEDPSFIVAPNLIGKLLIREDGRVGMIVEVEAYEQSDEASHTFCGLTDRNRAMFGLGGHLYVYISYGLHFCANVVTGPENYGSGVLIRALQPLSGIDIMREQRGVEDIKKLCNGPGNLAQAFSIDKSLYGLDLTIGKKLFIAQNDNLNKFDILSTPRIGISKNKEKPWRFILKDSPFLSKKVV